MDLLVIADRSSLKDGVVLKEEQKSRSFRSKQDALKASELLERQNSLIRDSPINLRTQTCLASNNGLYLKSETEGRIPAEFLLTASVTISIFPLLPF
jgi:hypothetical protein